MLYEVITHMVTGGKPNYTIFGLFALMLVVMGRMVWADVRNMSARRKLGQISLAVEPSEVMRGQIAQVRVAVNPLDNARLNRVTATLIGEEVAVSGSGTSRTTHRHQLDSVETSYNFV